MGEWTKERKKQKLKPKEFKDEAKISVHNILNKVTNSKLEIFVNKLVNLMSNAEEQNCLEDICKMIVSSIFTKASLDKEFGLLYVELLKQALYSAEISSECYKTCRKYLLQKSK